MIAGTGNAVAAAPVNQILEVVLVKDGQTIDAGRTVMKDQFGTVTPFVMTSGTEIGFGTRSKDGNTRQMSSNSKFVGRSIVVKPVAEESGKFRLSITATDTVSTGVDTVGPTDCPSQVVKTSGLEVKDVSATIADDETVDVPLGNPHYQLRLTLKAASE